MWVSLNAQKCHFNHEPAEYKIYMYFFTTLIFIV